MAQISEVGVAQGHVGAVLLAALVALPAAIGAPGKPRLIAHAGLVSLESLDREEYSER